MQLKPIFLRNIAKIVNMDVSTISRAIQKKTLQTTWGIYPLKYFFSQSIPDKQGKEVSTRVIKQTLATLISEENKQAPYNDNELREQLKNQGFVIARRTVAKYREQLNIPVAKFRKIFF